MLKRKDSVLRACRPTCHHNFRPTARRISAGHASVCLLCICERIDEFFENDSENIPPAQNINDIMYNVRLINTTLDSYDRMDGALSEITVRPVVDTLIGLLKLANDEIGLMIAQAMQMICSKITTGLQTYLLEKIVSQIRESTTGLSLGVAECLRVILQIEECLVVFQEKFGQEILPIVLQALRSRGNVERRHLPFPSQKRLFHNNSDSPCETNINSQSGSQNSSVHLSSGQGFKDDKNRMIIVLYAIIEKAYEIPSSGGKDTLSLDLSQKLNEEDTRFQAYVPFTNDIVADCIKQLSESHNFSVLSQVLGLLAKMLKQVKPLSTILSTGQGYSLLSLLKKMLFSPCSKVQKESLIALISALETYQSSSILSASTGEENPVETLPTLMHKVDLIHGLSQTISTSDPDTCRIFFQLMIMLHSIPFFKGKLLLLLEDALRISALSLTPGGGVQLHGIHNFFFGVLNDTEKIPFTVQKQILSVYGNLPAQTRPVERLQWAKLLIHCSDPSLGSILVQFYEKSIEMLQSNECSVSHLKVTLTLYCTVMDSSEQEELTDARSSPSFLLTLMKMKCLPAVKALATEGSASESLYIRMLLIILLQFPLDRLKPPRKMSIDSHPASFFAVEYEIEDDDSCSSIARTQEVFLTEKGLFDEHECWSAAAYMKILSWIRPNMELLKDKVVFDLWNENVGRIVSEKSHLYFPGISSLWPHIPSDENVPARRTFFSAILDKLDLDMKKWSELLGHNSLENMELDEHLKLQQEGILVYYYYYFLFTMDDDKTLLSPTFLHNLGQLLQNFNNNLEHLECSGTSKEDVISAYFKLSFLIYSCQLSSLEFHPDVVTAYESMILDLETVLDEDPQRVVTFCGKVFHVLMEWQLLPLFQMSIMINAWAAEDNEEFQFFFENVDLSSNDLNDDTVASFKALVLEIAAEGSDEASEFLVQLVHHKRLQNPFNFDPGNIYEKLIQKKNDIVSRCASAVPLSTLKNFASLLELAMGDEPMFCKELIHFPAEFFDDLIQIILKFYRTKSIGATCMRFLWKYLSLCSNIDVQRICLQNHDFIHLLGNFIHKQHISSMYELTHYSYEIMSAVVKACDVPADYRVFWKQGSVKVKWRIFSVLYKIQYTSINLSWLRFLSTMLAVNFEHDVIEVEEIKLDQADLWKILLTVNFHVQNLFHKIQTKEDEDLIWNFFFEVLCFSRRMDSRSSNNGNNILSGRLYADPWNAFLIEITIHKAPSPFHLSETCLKYLSKWMKTVVIHLKMAGRKNIVCPPDVPYQVYSFLGLLHKLYQFLGCGQEEMPQDLNITDVQGEIDWNARCPVRILSENDKEKKTLIEKLVKYCTIILETHQGKELCGYETDEEESSLIGNTSELDNMEEETTENNSFVPIEESQRNPTKSGCEPNGLSDSSTCSESELENMLTTK